MSTHFFSRGRQPRLFFAAAVMMGLVSKAQGEAQRSNSCQNDGLTAQVEQVQQALESDTQPQCSPIAEGTAREVSLSYEASPTGIPHAYRLIRVSGDNFEVAFNLQLQNVTGRQKQELESRVRECLSQANESWRGPAGQSLSFRLVNRGEQAPPVRIRVGPTPDGRNYSDRWNPTIQCESIMHEMLHHAGLIDEYAERDIRIGRTEDHGRGQPRSARSTGRRTSGPAYDCRRVWTDNSVMSNAQFAYLSLSAPQIRTVQYCQCAAGDTPQCRQIANSANQQTSGTTCPAGFRVRPGSAATYPHFPDMGVVPMAPVGISAAERARLIPIANVSDVPAEQTSLFRQRFFDAIVFPGCRAKNDDYYVAAENAYRTSQRHGGAGCRATPSLRTR